jgi:curved DNA-binding protein CbpA
MTDDKVEPLGESGLAGWIAVLDALSYYEIFGVDRTASSDEIRDAFHRFSGYMHPDRHVGRPAAEREQVATIFKRGTEAYMVLSDPALRGRYDAQLSAIGAGGSTAAQRLSGSLSRPPPKSAGPPKLEDAVRSPSARPFARRAEELMQAGDFRQAKLQLVMANHMDPENEALTEALREAEAVLKGLRPPKRG